MPDDWSWMWSSEAGRARMLRDEIEGLQGETSAARAQTARLSSQLSTLEGSLATRLNALSAAFDAYVELGDVREQLDGYPDTSAVRRDASAAIQMMTRGGTPAPVADRGQGYWLAYAVNALIALVAGRPDVDFETKARELDHDAELFIVAAAGALGHGADVATRLPDLLVCDGDLTTAQLTLWRAALDDQFGDAVPAIGAVWRSALKLDADSWSSWAKSESRRVSPTEALRWIDAELTGEAPALVPPPTQSALVPAESLVLAGEPAVKTATASEPTEVPPPDHRAGLRDLVGRLVTQGMGAEVTLLARARVLRARIEDPTTRTEDDADPESEPDRADLTTEVRRSLLAAHHGSDQRAELLGWVLPGLLEATSALESESEQAVVAPVEARTPAGVISVTATGADPARLARADAGLVQMHTVPGRRVTVPAVVTGVAAVLAVIGLAGGITVLSVLAILVLVVAGGLTIAGWSVRRSGQRSLAVSRSATSSTVAAAERQAQVAEQARADAVADAHRLALVIRDRVKALTTAAAGADPHHELARRATTMPRAEGRGA